MPATTSRRVTLACAVAIACATTLGGVASSASAAIRVVTYNVNADTDRNNDGTIDSSDATYATSSVADVMRAIGGYALAGNAQAPDVISLQELFATPSTTLNAIVSNLNSTYGAGTYAYDPTVGAVNSVGAVGNGPNGLIYNAKTIKVLGVKQIGSAVGSGGEARAPLRYQLQSLAAPTNNTFYVYSEHTKAGTGTTNATRRAYETDGVRADADALGAAAHVLYTGDFNLSDGSSEAAYQDLLAAGGTTLSTSGNPNAPTPRLVAGAAQAFDPQTTSFSGGSNAQAKYYTESAGYLSDRIDLQLVTANTLSGSTSLGLRMVDKSYLSFGAAYYTAAGVLASANNANASIYNGANYNTAVTGYTPATLNSLLIATDHLPVVADYVIVVPEPTMLGTLALVVTILHRRRRIVVL